MTAEKDRLRDEARRYAQKLAAAGALGVPVDTMAATCRAITKPAPVIAATICAISRVRFGPSTRNIVTVSAIAAAAADSPSAITTP